MHPISEGEILFHSDRVAACTLARCGSPNIRMKSFGICANAGAMPASKHTGATNPNHLDTAFLPTFVPQLLLLQAPRRVFKRVDPVANNLVASLARPGGNVTGLSNQSADLAGKRLELLREVVPSLGRLAILVNVGNPAAVLEMGEAQAAARTLGLDVATLEIRRPEDIAHGFEALKDRAEVLYICIDPLTDTNRIRINASALGARLPTISGFREDLEAGGLIFYGPNVPHLFRRAADYVDKILRGAKPADIPVEQPTKFDLVINLTTAKALGLTIPESFLLRADEVIE
jgi:putative tryptophan/tyrosine transport system substrate-binding protein